jgi:hypothetical protein
MKLYLKMGLALAIVFVFLMTSKLLTSEAASAGANPPPRIDAESHGVVADARIHRTPPPDNGIEKADLDVGKINVDFPPGGSASAQFNNSELSLLGTRIVASGPGSGTTSITQTGPQAFRVQNDYTVDEVYYANGGITFDRVRARLICNVVSGQEPSCSQDVVFKNLMVNGEKLPDRPEPNTKREFIKQVTIGNLSFPVKYEVTLNVQGLTTRGNKTLVNVAGIDATGRSLNNGDEPESQEAMLFDPFTSGIKTSGPNNEWTPSHLISPGAKIRGAQVFTHRSAVVCVPIDTVIQQ